MKVSSLIIALFCFLFISCSNDSPDIPNPGTPDVEDEAIVSDEVFYQTMAEMSAISDIVESSETKEALISTLKSNSIVKDILSDESTLIITTVGGRRIHINLDYQELESDQQIIDDRTELIDSISSLFDFETLETQSKSIPQHKAADSSRASNTSSPFLRRRNLLIFSPDLQFRAEDSVHLFRLAEQLRKRNLPISVTIHPISSYTPSYFKNFSNYDIVMSSSHGTDNGRIYFPWGGMPEKMQRLYMSMSDNEDETGVYLAINKSKSKGNIEASTGVCLGEKFFNKYLGSLESTIVWASKCYSGKILGEFRDACCVKKHALEYFGPTRECTNPEVYAIFDYYLLYLLQGMDSWSAFLKAPESGDHEKYLASSGGTLGSHKLSRARYPKSQPTGVKNSSTRHANASRAEAQSTNTIVGAAFRYPVDDKGNALDKVSAGVILTDLSDNTSTEIPITLSNTKSVWQKEISETFKAGEFDVNLGALQAGKSYSYSTFVKSGDDCVISDEVINFVAESAPAEYKIYSEADFLSIPEDDYTGTAYLMNDISVNISKSFYFNVSLQGGNHTVTLTPTADNVYLTLGNKWTETNISIDAEYSEYRALNGFLKTNYSCELDHCNFIGLESSRTWVSHNYGYIHDCVFDDAQVRNNYGTLENCTIIGPFKNNYKADHVADTDFMSCNDGTIKGCTITDAYCLPQHGHGNGFCFVETNIVSATIEDCHILNGYNIVFCDYNSGLIKDCSAKGESDKTHAVIYYNIGLIDGFTNYANIDSRNIPATSSPIAFNHFDGTITNFVNHGNIKGSGGAYAISEKNYGKIDNCQNYGDIEVWPWYWGTGQCEGSGHDKTTVIVGGAYIPYHPDGIFGTVSNYTNYGSYIAHDVCIVHNVKYQEVSVGKGDIMIGTAN